MGISGRDPPPDLLTIRGGLDVVFDMADEMTGAYGDTADEWREWLAQFKEILVKELPKGIVAKKLERL